jgi:ubiquinone/menaquinone biosynthesis C-methylase UbiE
MDISRIKDILSDDQPPVPWAEGDNIPWNEPEFSKRMLKYHLSQENDLASRRFEIIDQHVNWIHSDLLKDQPSSILDICCGPGFYSKSLAKSGHKCLGIDYSPASIEYAERQVADTGLDCHYILGDIREVGFGNDHDLVMLIFGEFSVFTKAQAGQLLSKAFKALKPNGMLLLEVHTFDAIKEIGSAKSSSQFLEEGLFLDKPHIYVEKPYWNDQIKAATKRFIIIESPGFEVTKYAVSYQAYANQDLKDLIESAGFTNIQFAPNPKWEIKEDFADSLIFVTAQKKD